MHRKLVVDRCQKLLDVYGTEQNKKKGLSVSEVKKTRLMEGEQINASQLKVVVPISDSITLHVTGELAMAADSFPTVVDIQRSSGSAQT